MTVRRFAPLIALLLSAAPATAQSLAFTDVTVIDVVEGAAERARLDRMLEQLATDAENWPE